MYSTGLFIQKRRNWQNYCRHAGNPNHKMGYAVQCLQVPYRQYGVGGRLTVGPTFTGPTKRLLPKNILELKHVIG
jgi:hypothetical protein